MNWISNTHSNKAVWGGDTNIPRQLSFVSKSNLTVKVNSGVTKNLHNIATNSKFSADSARGLMLALRKTTDKALAKNWVADQPQKVGRWLITLRKNGNDVIVKKFTPAPTKAKQLARNKLNGDRY